jgi:hypothetical protein
LSQQPSAQLMLSHPKMQAPPLHLAPEAVQSRQVAPPVPQKLSVWAIRHVPPWSQQPLAQEELSQGPAPEALLLAELPSEPLLLGEPPEPP